MFLTPRPNTKQAGDCDQVELHFPDRTEEAIGVALSKVESKAKTAQTCGWLPAQDTTASCSITGATALTMG